MAFYDSKTSALTLTIRAEKIFTEQERRGFFRIGLLPVAVLEGVRVEVPQTIGLTNDLASLLSRQLPLKTDRLELRNVTITTSGDPRNRLECGRVRVRPGGKWEFLNGISVTLPNNETSAAAGTLEIAGPNAGRLTLKTSPPTTLNIYELWRDTMNDPKPAG